MAGEKKGRKAAVALGYDPKKDEAPRILAAGQGELAEAVLNLAQKHKIPVHTDHPLANALVKLEVGAAIPPELYAAVAEVLAFLWRLEQEKAAAGGGPRS
ncbi:MAG TPA: EscU/YscU/HrcU family type III secretion system export apparatus switch protein [Symbiobacteriaceae bacterium]|nr:EscU/YscU/HrcU family type III secretion system export apparatus switch protein [Symbiobacteriaceae bacterium]